MQKSIDIQRGLVIIGIPLLLIGAMVLITKSAIFVNNSNGLSVGVTFDLLLTIPFVYFLLIRKTNIPKTTIVPVIVAGVFIGSLILPAENQYFLSLFRVWALPVIEISVVFFIIYNVRKGIKRYNHNKSGSPDFLSTLRSTCDELLPGPLAVAFVTEISVFYYGFIYWKRRALKENEFSYHKDSGTISLLGVIIFIILIETVSLHVLLAKWSIVAAWALTLVSIYSGIQILGFLKSMMKRPILIENGWLYLRYGIMAEAVVNLEDIDSVEISSKDIELNEETRKLSLLGDLESHNIVIHFNKENTLTRLYGMKRKFKTLALYVDKKEEFKSEINKALQTQS